MLEPEVQRTSEQCREQGSRGADTTPERQLGHGRTALVVLKVVVPVVSVCVGAAGVISTVVIHRQQMALQTELKRAETINSRREVYVNFIEAMEASYREARSAEWLVLVQSFQTLERAFIQMEPFMAEVRRQWAWRELHDFEVFCKDVWKLQRSGGSKGRNLTGEFVEGRERIKAQLRAALFQ